MRAVHGLVGVVFTPLLIAVALSGAVLAWRPVSAPAPLGGSVSELLARIAAMPEVVEIDRLERSPGGAVVLHHYHGGTLVKERIGADARLPEVKEGPLQSAAQTLHRELFAGRKGRLVVGVTAGAMSVLSVTGLWLILRRAGGWRGLLSPAQGAGAGRLHALAGRFFLLPLAILALTGLWMSLESFGVIQSELPRLRGLPDSTKIEPIPDPAHFPVFDRSLREMHALSFPFAGDWFDVFVLQTGAERLIIDQGTGAVLERRPLPLAYRVSQWIYRLHSGAGLRLWAVVLGLAALVVPVFSVTGTLLWVRRRGQTGGATTEAVTIFVGSENGSTWVFARALAEAIRSVGQAVALADLNSLAARSGQVQTALILTSTYGDGVGPQNGDRAAAGIARIRAPLRYAVLGFGDRQFPAFCAYAEALDTALEQSGAHERLMPLRKVNQQSRQVFSDWVHDLGAAMGLALPEPQIKRADRPRSMALRDIRRFPDPEGVTAVLRFHPNRRMRFKPGDLVEVLPPDGGAPRAYSIASAPGAQSFDLVVREHEQGLMSPLITRMQPGEALAMIHKPSSFRMPASGPVLMIATGTGIAPFMSMIAASRRADLTLYWGLRHRPDDYPFRPEILRWQDAGRLNFRPAFSGQSPRQRVPDLMQADHARIRADLIDRGGATLICGSLHAARDIRAVLSGIISGSGTTLEDLKRQKRHLEDVY